jgi:hypothetical protein
MEVVNEKIEKICNKSNVYFLNNKKIKINNVSIIGTTLWTHIPDEHKTYFQKRINDYQKIYQFTPDYCNILHEKNIKFIQENIEENTIVLTHHAPLNKGVSAPKYEKDVTRYAYTNDLSYMLKPPISAWCFGHTHWQTDFKFNNISILSNPVGYGNELFKNKQIINFARFLKI